MVGAIAFRYTEPFYTDPTYGLNLQLPSPLAVLTAQLIRGPVYGLALVGVVLAPIPSRRYKMVMAGALLFVLGGFTPLLTNTDWPVALRVYHTIEIFFRNVPMGALVILLLGAADKPRHTV